MTQNPQPIYQNMQFTNPQHIMVSTTDEIPGYEIVEYRGIVFGITVRTRGAGGQCMGNCQACFGGEVTAFTTMSIEARNDAYQRLVAEAAARGANGIVRVLFDSSAGGTSTSMTDIVAYGTAVVVRPKMR